MDNNFSLGADPEIFVNRGDGSLFNAFEFLGSKEAPNKTKAKESVYWDGFQAEFTVKPSSNIKEVVESIRLGLSRTLELARKMDHKARLSFNTVVDTPVTILEKLPKQYVEFGCMPSYNIYGITGIGGEGHTVPYRFAGGHIHLGIGHVTNNEGAEIIRALDRILAVGFVSAFENIDNPIRRQYYGLAGEHRNPPHGKEYRTLSNGWVFDPGLASETLNLSRNIVTSAMEGTASNWKVKSDSEIIETILLSDLEKARFILNQNKEMLSKLTSLNLALPIEASYPNIRNIEQNWGL